MKKLLILVALVTVVAMSLVACKDDKTPAETTGSDVVTSAPEESSNTPEESSSTPEESSSVPEESSSVPEESSSTPEESSVAPEESSSTPEESSTEPEVTSTEPEVTSTEPEVTSTEPEVTSTEPEETSTEPEETVPAPIEELDVTDSAFVDVKVPANSYFIINHTATKRGQLLISSENQDARFALIVDGEIVKYVTGISLPVVKGDTHSFAVAMVDNSAATVDVVCELVPTPEVMVAAPSKSFAYVGYVDFINGAHQNDVKGYRGGASGNRVIVDAKIPGVTADNGKLAISGWALVNGGQDKYFWSVDGETWYEITKVTYGDTAQPHKDAANVIAGVNSVNPNHGLYDMTIDLSTYEGQTVTVYVAVRSTTVYNGVQHLCHLFTFTDVTVGEAESDPEEDTTTPEATEGEPVHNVGLDHIVSVGNSSLPIHSSSTSATWAGDNSYVTLRTTGDDPYVAAIEMLSSIPVTNRLYIVYRTTTAGSPEFFFGSGANWTGLGDRFDGEAYIADGEWHLMVVDMSASTAFNGTTAGYLRFDYFTSFGTVVPADYTLDLMMVAFFNNDAEAEAYVAANFGLSFEDDEEETTDPTEDSSEPTEDSSEPTEDSSEPTEDSSEPTEDSSEPTEDSSEPTEDSSELTEDSSEPTEDSSEPTEDSSEPTEDSSEPTEDSSEPTEDSSEPEVTVVDPVYNVGLNHIVSMAGSSMAIHGQHASAAWAQDNSFVTLTVNGADPYVAAIEMNSNVVATNRLYIVYRTNTEAAPEIFIGSGSGWSGAGDTLTADAYIADGEWHLMVIDLSTLTAFDGTNAGYLRYDFFATDAAPNGATIDVKMIAFFNNDADAEAYAAANFGLSFEDDEEETTDPTEDSSEPTEDSSEPTEDSSEPTEDSSEPTEDSSEPTEDSSEPEVTVVDPVYNVGLGHIVDMAGSSLTMHGQHSSAAWAQDNSFVTLTVNGADPYVAAIEMGSSIPVTNRLYIVYRTTTASAPEFFFGSGANWTGGADHLDGEAYIADGEWHLMVVDLSASTAFNGTTAGYLRFDYFTNNGVAVPADATIDIKMVAFFNNDAEAEAYVAANYGLSFETEEETDVPFAGFVEYVNGVYANEIEGANPAGGWDAFPGYNGNPAVAYGITAADNKITLSGAAFVTGDYDKFFYSIDGENWMEITEFTRSLYDNAFILWWPANYGVTAALTADNALYNAVIDLSAYAGQTVTVYVAARSLTTVNGAQQYCHLFTFADVVVGEVETEPHTCVFENYTQTAAPTCTTPGSETATCTCGLTDTRDIPVDANAHKWDNGTVVPATKEAGGYTLYTCEYNAEHTYQDNFTAPLTDLQYNVSGHANARDFADAAYTSKILMMNPDITSINLGALNLANYKKVIICYGSDPNAKLGDAGAKLCIASADSTLASAALTNATGFWMRGSRTVVIDLTEVTYSGDVYLKYDRASSTDGIAISAIFFGVDAPVAEDTVNGHTFVTSSMNTATRYYGNIDLVNGVAMPFAGYWERNPNTKNHVRPEVSGVVLGADNKLNLSGWALMNGSQDGIYWSIDDGETWSKFEGAYKTAEVGSPVYNAAKDGPGLLSVIDGQNAIFDGEGVTVDLSAYEGQTLNIKLAVGKPSDGGLCHFATLVNVVV